MDIETQKNKLDSIAVWSITPNGMMIGQKIHKAVKGSSLFVSKKNGRFENGLKQTGRSFRRCYILMQKECLV